MKKVGNNAFFFRLNDYAKPNPNGYLSSRIYFEVNCLDLSYRYLKDFYHKEPMGNGEYIIYDKIGEWENNTKGSIVEKTNKFACNYD